MNESISGAAQAITCFIGYFVTVSKYQRFNIPTLIRKSSKEIKFKSLILVGFSPIKKFHKLNAKLTNSFTTLTKVPYQKAWLLEESWCFQFLKN